MGMSFFGPSSFGDVQVTPKGSPVASFSGEPPKKTSRPHGGFLSRPHQFAPGFRGVLGFRLTTKEGWPQKLWSFAASACESARYMAPRPVFAVVFGGEKGRRVVSLFRRGPVWERDPSNHETDHRSFVLAALTRPLGSSDLMWPFEGGNYNRVNVKPLTGCCLYIQFPVARGWADP